MNPHRRARYSKITEGHGTPCPSHFSRQFRMRTPNADTRDLLAMKPKRNLQWETKDGDSVVLIIPKFKHPLLVKWFVPMLAKPNIRVKLDALGSFVWNRCDGLTSIETIGAEMSSMFGEPVEPLYERIGKFVAKLERSKFLLLES